MTTNVPLLRVENLVKRYRTRAVVDNVSFSIARGETLGLVGESGCGKSTLARTVLLLEKPDTGRIVLDGADLTGMSAARLRPLRHRMQMVFQDNGSAFNPRFSVEEILAEPLASHGLASDPAERNTRIVRLLYDVGLDTDILTRRPHELSGGQRQRIGIARALAPEPELVIADEPTAALDVSVRAQILNLFVELQERRGLAFLFVSHDLPAVAHVSHRVLKMHEGRLV